MKLDLILLLLFLSIPTIIFSQESSESCACCSSNHKAFDFWIGDWEVFNASGTKIGENVIEALEDHCIINENWTGTAGGSGKSYNYYDADDHTWNQLWISSTGTILKLKGKADPGKMVLRSEMISGEKGKYYNQITWTKNTDGSVTQLWELLDANDQIISKSFEGIYRRKD